jgi:uncharacterized protein (TIGR02996 family)
MANAYWTEPMEEDAFLKALQANPEGDLSRRVHAVWLDERDDPRFGINMGEVLGADALNVYYSTVR